MSMGSQKKHTTMREKGFTILFAALVASLLLAIGLSIFGLTLKGLTLSSSARESVYAFFAADTGIECALYFDRVPTPSAFSTSSPASSVNCAGADRDVVASGGGGMYIRTFEIDLAPEPYCAEVTVTKTQSPRRTVVESRGYNTCDTENPRRVERALRAQY